MRALMIGSLVGGVALAQTGVWEQRTAEALKAAASHDYAKAERLFAEAAREAQRLGETDLRLASTLNSLGLVFSAQKKFRQAETAYRRSMAIIEANSSSENIDAGNIALNLGSVLIEEGKHSLAVPYLQRALKIYEHQLGAESPKTAQTLFELGEAYRVLRQYSEAEVVLKRAGEIREANIGIDSPDLARALNSLALAYTAQGK